MSLHGDGQRVAGADVEFERRRGSAGFDNRLRVCGGDSSEKIRAIEVSGVEEVGRYALGFQLEAAEFEDPTIDGCMEEFGLVLGKGGGRHGECEEKSFE